MISAFDVKYFEDGGAMVAAVVFKDYRDSEPVSSYQKRIDIVHEYVPGSFYRRELPCILSLLADIKEKIDTIIVDGYVFLGGKPGLGAYLRERVEKKQLLSESPNPISEGVTPSKSIEGQAGFHCMLVPRGSIR